MSADAGHLLQADERQEQAQQDAQEAAAAQRLENGRLAPPIPPHQHPQQQQAEALFRPVLPRPLPQRPTVLITGASCAVGAALMRALTARGARCALLGERPPLAALPRGGGAVLVLGREDDDGALAEAFGAFGGGAPAAGGGSAAAAGGPQRGGGAVDAVVHLGIPCAAATAAAGASSAAAAAERVAGGARAVVRACEAFGAARLVAVVAPSDRRARGALGAAVGRAELAVLRFGFRRGNLASSGVGGVNGSGSSGGASGSGGGAGRASPADDDDDDDGAARRRAPAGDRQAAVAAAAAAVAARTADPDRGMWARSSGLVLLQEPPAEPRRGGFGIGALGGWLLGLLPGRGGGGGGRPASATARAFLEGALEHDDDAAAAVVDDAVRRVMVALF